MRYAVGNDFIEAGGGRDLIEVRGGDDEVHAGAGDDLIDAAVVGAQYVYPVPPARVWCGTTVIGAGSVRRVAAVMTCCSVMPAMTLLSPTAVSRSSTVARTTIICSRARAMT